jgi:BirA family transcriptional regulator, biotin operon repressor / biotin---[acetyl-CoA-carboxylase] ligase
VTSPYADLDRPPLRAAALRRALSPDGWRIEVLASAGSTNAVVADRSRAGEPPGLVVVAEQQTAGRGRLDRAWTSPPRAGLTFSVLLRPAWPAAAWPWIPLLSGWAVARALREQGELDAVLKWPNDVLVGSRKICGVLTEMPEPGVAVVGIGLNVTTREDELPGPGATSMRLEEAATTDRDTVLRAVLRALRDALADRDTAIGEYRAHCATVGRRVRIDLPGGTTVTGTAEAVDDGGQLVVDGVPRAAGDVVHATPLSP